MATGGIVRFETPSRKIYRFNVLGATEHAPDEPGIYAVFLPRRPRERQDTPLVWGLSDTPMVELAHTYTGRVKGDPRVDEALRLKGAIFATMVVAGHFARRRILSDLQSVPAIYDLAHGGAVDPLEDNRNRLGRGEYKWDENWRRANGRASA